MLIGLTERFSDTVFPLAFSDGAYHPERIAHHVRPEQQIAKFRLDLVIRGALAKGGVDLTVSEGRWFRHCCSSELETGQTAAVRHQSPVVLRVDIGLPY